MVKIEQSLRECTGAVNIVTSEVSANEVLPNPQKLLLYRALYYEGQYCDNKHKFLLLFLKYHILLSIMGTFLHWKWSWNIPCTLYLEGSWGRVKLSLLWLINLQWLILVKFVLKNKKDCQKSLWNLGLNYTSIHITLDKIR